MTADNRSPIERAADEALARLEARYTPDPLVEAAYAHWHAAQHPTPAEQSEAHYQQARAEMRRQATLRRRRDRAWQRARIAAQAAADAPGDASLAARSAHLRGIAESEERDWQESQKPREFVQDATVKTLDT